MNNAEITLFGCRFCFAFSPRFKKGPYKTNLEQFTKSGGFKVSGSNGLKNAESLLQHVEKGKEYFFTSGRHAAIVRLKGNIRQREKLFEFLELQDSSKDGNGFQELTEPILKSRFFTKVGRKECVDFLIDIEKIKDSPKFRELLGYLNTQGP